MVLHRPAPPFDDWRPLFEQELGLTYHCPTVTLREHGVTTTAEQRIEGNRRYTIIRKETPIGTLRQVTLNSQSIPQSAE